MLFPNNSFLEPGLMNSFSLLLTWRLYPRRVRRCIWKGGNVRRERDAPSYVAPRKAKAVSVPGFVTPSPAELWHFACVWEEGAWSWTRGLARSETETLTAKGKGFLEFGAWEVHLGLQYRNLQGYLHSSWACVFMNIIFLCSNLCSQRTKNAISWLSTACWDSGFTPVVTIYMLLLETLR